MNNELFKKHCINCNIVNDYNLGNITIEQARKKCSNCHFGSERIYKFDLLLNYIDSYNKHLKQLGNIGKGKSETYSKKYGNAILQLRSEGYSIRHIANVLNISPTSVQKIINQIMT